MSTEGARTETDWKGYNTMPHLHLRYKNVEVVDSVRY